MAEQLARNNSALLLEIQNKKGIAFVVLSSILLFLISHSLYKRLRRSAKSNTTLEQKFEALNAAARGGMIDYDTDTKTATINDKMRFFIPGEKHTIHNFFDLFLDRIHKADVSRITA